MKVGIIGAGNIGSVLVKRLGTLGHAVRIANSRGPETLSTLSRETGASAVSVDEVARGADLLILTIPLKNVPTLSSDLFEQLPLSSPIVDTGNYYPLRDGRIEAIDNGVIESEWTSHFLGREVIKAFNSITADSLLHRGLPKGSANRIALPVAGGSVEQRQTVMGLVESLGFDAFDAGSLADSWRFQPGTPAYASDPNLQQLPVLLKKADREKAPKNRDFGAKLLGDLVFTLPQSDLVRLTRLSAGLDTFKLGSWIASLRVILAVLRSRSSLSPKGKT